MFCTKCHNEFQPHCTLYVKVLVLKTQLTQSNTAAILCESNAASDRYNIGIAGSNSVRGIRLFFIFCCPTYLEPCDTTVCSAVCLRSASKFIVSEQIFQINQPTRCKNFKSLLLFDYIQLNMFWGSSRPSSGFQQLQ
jgi:hypothetical protein